MLRPKQNGAAKKVIPCSPDTAQRRLPAFSGGRDGISGGRAGQVRSFLANGRNHTAPTRYNCLFQCYLQEELRILPPLSRYICVQYSTARGGKQGKIPKPRWPFALLARDSGKFTNHSLRLRIGYGIIAAKRPLYFDSSPFSLPLRGNRKNWLIIPFQLRFHGIIAAKRPLYFDFEPFFSPLAGQPKKWLIIPFQLRFHGM